MKIAIVVRRYDRQGGISKGTVESAERLVKMGHEVHVFTNEFKDIRESRVIFHHVPMLKLSFLNGSTIKKLSILLEGISFLITSRLLCRYEDFDIIHVKGDSLARFDIYSAHSCHLAWLEMAKRDVKGKIEWIRRNLNPHHLRILFTERYNYSPKNYKKIIAVSEGVKREIIKYYGVPGNKIVVIPNGVDLEEFNPKNRLVFYEAIRKRFRIREDAVVLIFVGHYFERKGLRYIIEALSMIDGRIILFVLGGDDQRPYKRQARNLGVEEKIIFLGHQLRPQEFYAASDIFIFPTSYEASSHAVLEAAASGLPILACKVNGIEDILQDGVNGYYIKRNTLSIVERLKVLIEDKDLREDLGKNARLTAAQYSWDEITKRILDVYREVYREKKG